MTIVYLRWKVQPGSSKNIRISRTRNGDLAAGADFAFTIRRSRPVGTTVRRPHQGRGSIDPDGRRVAILESTISTRQRFVPVR